MEGTTTTVLPNSRRRGAQKGTTGVGDEFVFTPLGSGREVGRSCHILRFKGKTIMLDCGIHPGYEGIDSLPFLEEINLNEVDVILISHYHLDHVAALPYLLKNKDAFKAKVYMTHPTKSIYKALLLDFIRVTYASGRDMLYTTEDIISTMDQIQVINFHQVVSYKGIRFWAYHAGHVLGAAMFMIEIDGHRFQYTGDYSRSKDRHLVAAEIPQEKPDILIIEATHGTLKHDSVAFREKRFTQFVHQIVARGGKCLIPQFALGRAQELLLILEQYWSNTPSLHNVPIYYMSALAKKCLKDYQIYINMMNNDIQEQAQKGNPFKFKYIINIPSSTYFSSIENGTGPCVVIASPGMQQNGWSRRLFDSWCSNSLNGLMLAGYSVENTLAHTIQTSIPNEIITLDGLRKPLSMSINVVPFTAHADYVETSAFISELHPQCVIFVHGNKKEMASLEKKLTLQYANDPTIEFFSPENSQMVTVPFAKKKLVRVVGQLANEILSPSSSSSDSNTQDMSLIKQNSILSGLIVHTNYNYLFMKTDDLQNFVHLSSTQVQHKVSVPFQQSFHIAKALISQIYQVTQNEDPEEAGENPDTLPEKEKTQNINETESKKTNTTTQAIVENSIQIHECVRQTNYVGKKALRLSWHSNPCADIVADSIIAILMAAEASPCLAKDIETSIKSETVQDKDVNDIPSIEWTEIQLKDMLWLLEQQFGGKYWIVEPKLSDTTKKICFNLQSYEGTIDISTLRVTIKSSSDIVDTKHQPDILLLELRIEQLLERFYSSIFPLRKIPINCRSSQDIDTVANMLKNYNRREGNTTSTLLASVAGSTTSNSILDDTSNILQAPLSGAMTGSKFSTEDDIHSEIEDDETTTLLDSTKLDATMSDELHRANADVESELYAQEPETISGGISSDEEETRIEALDALRDD